MGNNIYAYEQESQYTRDSLNNIRGVFHVTVDQFNKSKDSLNVLLNKGRQELKIKDKELQEALNFTTVIHKDTFKIIQVNDSCEFSTTVELNKQTSIDIQAETDSLRQLKLNTRLHMTASFQVYIATKYE